LDASSLRKFVVAWVFTRKNGYAFFLMAFLEAASERGPFLKKTALVV
jgi:hypothetical protein